jgi:hypothetical protein
MEKIQTFDGSIDFPEFFRGKAVFDGLKACRLENRFHISS